MTHWNDSGNQDTRYSIKQQLKGNVNSRIKCDEPLFTYSGISFDPPV
ncbi:hypothetical protein Dxin01_03724 [Deinococcus xinjiangensis]|uniref:Uncharacterized protein n=1 Tax=Deinococcus xinjiangensis TaxID=457454 RepID=A0ABP9VFE7_9DEIO